ncbi:uncharacterized protein GGS25DRAFT_473470 [Hypoxylon fragiforme]|uniref:uncharacterized protein n=1 Tax=Hypoxylon fragiforme TaxID=63214 RepID=UPI0020C5DD9F|nr:uncharacterized protein GGS25DRAFT_473470 [Hypoxylon fragiforme]KAI2612022.1 hypothetical protein GGS25DRAFT_473470 [Hypoxylon fragiforme]
MWRRKKEEVGIVYCPRKIYLLVQMLGIFAQVLRGYFEARRTLSVESSAVQMYQGSFYGPSICLGSFAVFRLSYLLVWGEGEGQSVYRPPNNHPRLEVRYSSFQGAWATMPT